VLLWLVFVAIVGVLLLCYRKTSAATGRWAVVWTVVWSVGGLALAGLVYLLYEHGWLGAELAEPSDQPGADAATMFLSAYLLEYALAFGNVVMFAAVFKRHRVPEAVRPRIMLWGLAGGLVARALVVAVGTLLACASAWTLHVAGPFVGLQALSALISDSDDDTLDRARRPSHWRHDRVVDGDRGGRFWGRKDGRLALTIAGACALAIALLETVYALESATLLMAVSRTTFVVVLSSVVATIALRSWFSMLEVFEDLRFPRFSVSALLLVIAIKLLARDRVPVSHVETLAVITALVGAGVAEMLLAARRARRVNRP
jgi:tellurite resistance protein TerC